MKLILFICSLACLFFVISGCASDKTRTTTTSTTTEETRIRPAN